MMTEADIDRIYAELARLDEDAQAADNYVATQVAAFPHLNPTETLKEPQ